MWTPINENPSREKILLLLKKGGPLSIDALSKELNITSMGIRQHLLSLERKGLIDYAVKRQGIGRPAFLYKLTEKAECLFPNTYDKFILHLLKDIENHDGRNKIEEIFKWRKTRLFKDAREAISDKKTLQDRVYGLKDFLESEGYLAEISTAGDFYHLILFNCPICKIAIVYKEACQCDLQIFRELLGKEVDREQCIINGNPSCTYSIPIPKNSSRQN
jgi:predicted ArsR family transcriptional regulator